MIKSPGIYHVLASSAEGSGFNPPSRTASCQRRYIFGTRSSLVKHWTLKGKTGSFSKKINYSLPAIFLFIDWRHITIIPDWGKELKNSRPIILPCIF